MQRNGELQPKTTKTPIQINSGHIVKPRALDGVAAAASDFLPENISAKLMASIFIHPLIVISHWFKA
jgi:hypothetical protein